MKRSKSKAEYQGLAFAKPFIKEIKNHINDDDRYRSVTDYVRQATREKMERDNLTPLEKYSNILKDMGSVKNFQKEVRKELNDIYKRSDPTELQKLKNLTDEVYNYKDAKLKEEEEWEREYFEYQLTHGTPSSIKETQKHLTKKYKKQNEQKLTDIIESIVIRTLKKEKKKTS